jgi:hypothetical protein
VTSHFTLTSDLIIGTIKCMNLYSLEFTYLCFIVSLGLLGDHPPFWHWKGNCAECKKPKKGLKALFCANFCFSRGEFPACRMVWCGGCYRKAEQDKFQINEPVDEFGQSYHEDNAQNVRYKVGTDGAHLILPFQCDICIFRSLFKREPREDISDRENQVVIRRMNLDLIWAREPSTIENNMRSLNKLITTCEAAGFDPQLPNIGPLPLEDKFGMGVAFSMLIHSRQKGRHSKSYTQFDTIRKQRSAFSNLFMISKQGLTNEQALAAGGLPKLQITDCPTSSIWFTRWSSGCETRMGYILKQNKAISFDLFKAMIMDFKVEASLAPAKSWERHTLICGLAYSIITFCGGLRGSEGLLVHWKFLKKYLQRGSASDPLRTGKRTPHIVVPLQGRFKQEKGEKCHLLVLAARSDSGIPIRSSIELFVQSREGLEDLPLVNNSIFAFCEKDGSKMGFKTMNEIILGSIDRIRSDDGDKNELGIKDTDLNEDYSINRSFRRGSTTHAQNQSVSKHVIEVNNRWRKFERAKGRKPKLALIEDYSDVEQLIPTLVQYSKRL